MTISPNNHNFPAGELTTTKPNLPTQDLAALMTGIYGSAPGCLCTFPNSPSCPGMEGEHQKLGQIATTVARGNGDRGYAGTYNYFDPDNVSRVRLSSPSRAATRSSAIRFDSFHSRSL